MRPEWFLHSFNSFKTYTPYIVCLTSILVVYLQLISENMIIGNAKKRYDDIRDWKYGYLNVSVPSDPPQF